MKHFVAVCTGKAYYGYWSSVIGVDAATAKSAEKKARDLENRYGRGCRNYEIFVEEVTEERERALLDIEWQWYLHATGVIESFTGGTAWWDFWNAACWSGEFYDNGSTRYQNRTHAKF